MSGATRSGVPSPWYPQPAPLSPPLLDALDELDALVLVLDALVLVLDALVLLLVLDALDAPVAPDALDDAPPAPVVFPELHAAPRMPPATRERSTTQVRDDRADMPTGQPDRRGSVKPRRPGAQNPRTRMYLMSSE